MKIVILGTTGAGKSFLSEIIAKAHGLKHIELDAFRFDKDWRVVSDEIFREKAKEALDCENWVADGNYSVSRDIVWTRADHVIWLDYPIVVIMWRLLKRTVRRIRKNEILWQGQKETVWKQFFSRDSLFLYALQTHWKRRKLIEKALIDPHYSHLKVDRFYSSNELEKFIKEFCPALEAL